MLLQSTAAMGTTSTFKKAEEPVKVLRMVTIIRFQDFWFFWRKCVSITSRSGLWCRYAHRASGIKSANWTIELTNKMRLGFMLSSSLLEPSP